jgi:hypothetical protein
MMLLLSVPRLKIIEPHPATVIAVPWPHPTARIQTVVLLRRRAYRHCFRIYSHDSTIEVVRSGVIRACSPSLNFFDVSNIEQRMRTPGVHAVFIAAVAPASTGH